MHNTYELFSNIKTSLLKENVGEGLLLELQNLQKLNDFEIKIVLYYIFLEDESKLTYEKKKSFVSIAASCQIPIWCMISSSCEIEKTHPDIVKHIIISYPTSEDVINYPEKLYLLLVESIMLGRESVVNWITKLIGDGFFTVFSAKNQEFIDKVITECEKHVQYKPSIDIVKSSILLSSNRR